MPFPLEIGNKCVVRIITTLGAQTAINVLNYRVSAHTASAATTAEAAEALDDSWHDEYKECMSITATYRGVSVQKLTGAAGVVPDFHLGNLDVGTENSTALPGQTSGLISWRSAFTGLSKRGRTYIPWPTETFNDPSGIPNATYNGKLAALDAALFGPHVIVGAAGTSTLVLVIRSTVLAADFDVLSAIPRPYWATQRRRGNFGQPNPPPF